MQLMACLLICRACGRSEDLERPAAMAPVTDQRVDGFQSASPSDELCARVSLGWTAAWLLCRLQRPCVTMASTIRPAPRHESKFSCSLVLRCQIESNLFLAHNYFSHESEKLWLEYQNKLPMDICLIVLKSWIFVRNMCYSLPVLENCGLLSYSWFEVIQKLWKYSCTIVKQKCT